MAFFDRWQDFEDDSAKLDCFRHFDANEKQYLDEKDFKRLVESLLDQNGDTLNESISKELFVSFDSNADNKIDANEFENVWNNFIKPLKHPVTALLVIDMQNDFIHGSLAVKDYNAKQDGYKLVPIINELIEKQKFDILVYTLDFHPKEHISFFNNIHLHKLRDKNKKKTEFKLFDTVWFYGPPSFEQKLWPIHCVAGTWGAELHQKLKVPKDSTLIYKGTNPKVDSYSAFWDNMKIFKTGLEAMLKTKKVTHVFVCGLTFDYCVFATAMSALELGFATVVIEDATCLIDENSAEVVRKKLVSGNCVLASSSEIENLIIGKDIRIEFAQIIAKFNKKN